MHLHKITLFDIDLVVKVTQSVAQYPLHHATYSDTKFEVVTSNCSGGDAFTSVVSGKSCSTTKDIGYFNLYNKLQGF